MQFAIAATVDKPVHVSIFSRNKCYCFIIFFNVKYKPTGIFYLKS